MARTSILTLLAAALVLAAGAASADSSRGELAPGSGPENLITAMEAAQLFGAPEAVAGAGIIRVDQSAFVAGSGLITFSEFPVGTVNPVYAPASYGGQPGDPVVNVRGFFSGQSLGTAVTCPPGAALTGCVVGSATAPLTLDPASPSTAIVNDGANPTSPVLSGSPTFNGPIAVVFDVDMAGVGLVGGFFDNVGSTAITAFRRDGTVIGSVLNTGTGIEFLGLVTADGTDSIAGLLFSLVGAESAGFAIDGLRFGTRGTVLPPQPPRPAVPAPANSTVALALLLLSMMAVGLLAIGRR
jgi:hypothetical protein